MGRNFKSIIESYVCDWITNDSIIYTDGDPKFNGLKNLEHNGKCYNNNVTGIVHNKGVRVHFDKSKNNKIHSQSIERFWHALKSLQKLRKRSIAEI